MAYPSYTKADLALFSGRAESTYTDYATASALPQAVLLFKIGTCLADFPEDGSPEADLAKFAILAMADAIILVQPFQTASANPFSSETIGSYSYSKVAGVVQGGLPTGIGWFDLAIQELSVCDRTLGIAVGGGIEVFEHDGLFVEGEVPGNVRLLGPADVQYAETYLEDPSQNFQWGSVYPD